MKGIRTYEFVHNEPTKGENEKDWKLEEAPFPFTKHMTVNELSRSSASLNYQVTLKCIVIYVDFWLIITENAYDHSIQRKNKNVKKKQCKTSTIEY